MLSTPEDIIREMIHQRDTGGYIAILAWRLKETVPDVSIARGVMNAVYNSKSLEECLALLKSTKPEQSSVNFVEEAATSS